MGPVTGLMSTGGSTDLVVVMVGAGASEEGDLQIPTVVVSCKKDHRQHYATLC